MIPRRALVVVATFLLSFLLYVDRVCISTAKVPIVAELGLTDAQFGWVLSAFAFGYALLQAPAGALADRYGARRILAMVVTFWSIFTGLTAAAWSFASMLVVRFLFGAGEAGAFPGMARAVYSWIPVNERGLVKGINFSASRLGAALTMPLLPWMIAQLGWKASFIVLMGIGVIWAVGWWLWFRDEPAEHRGITPVELAHIHATRQTQAVSAAPTAPLGVGTLLRSGNLWLMMGQYFAGNFTFFFCLSWLFPYVQKTYNLSYTQAGFYAMIPLLCGAAGNVFSGWMVDALFRANRPALSRRVPAIIGFVLAAGGLVLSANQAGVGGAVFWLSIAIFGADMTLSPSWSFCIDIGGKHAGQVSGTMNMAGNLGSALVALAFPYLLAWTGGAKTFFYVGAALNVVGIGLWMLARPEGKVEEGKS
ncbi:MAG: MFS transporter [Opitutaceae bacterium]|nr:MFS transporter [Opitutaceae bacterium]